jgi:protocatechuate 3,4-dioxygenase beta subunit
MARRPARHPWTDSAGRVIDEEDRGLVYDVETLLSRRRALGLFGALGASVLVAGCSGTSDSPASSGGSTTASGSASASSSSSPESSPPGSSSAATSSGAASGPVTEVPDETGGPFPGDGSNGVNVLDDSGIVRADIRSGFGSSATTAEGVPLTIRLTVRDSATGDAKPGTAVYVWHCDREGNYSLYSSGFEDVNYLRGVQTADRTGTVTFTSVFPGCYPGRWPHIHFEVYEGVAGATSSGPIVKTSQIALPKDACEVAYGSAGYGKSSSNLAQISLSSDIVFGDDGGIHQLASMSGSVEDGYVAALTVGV